MNRRWSLTETHPSEPIPAKGEKTRSPGALHSFTAGIFRPGKTPEQRLNAVRLAVADQYLVHGGVNFGAGVVSGAGKVLSGEAFRAGQRLASVADDAVKQRGIVGLLRAAPGGAARFGANYGRSIPRNVVAGAVIIAIFVSVATSAVTNSAVFSSSEKTTLNQAIVSKAQIASDQQLTGATSSLQPDKQNEILQINAHARQRALTVVYFVIGAVGLIGVVAVLVLPKTRPLG